MTIHRIGFSEGKACDAIIRVLEKRENAFRQNVTSPEHDGHAAPVELTFTLDDVLYAIEHTGIEPFEGHVAMEARIIHHLIPVQDMIMERARPSENVCLEVSEIEFRKMKRAQVDEFQHNLVNWVVENLSTIPIAKFGRYPDPYEPYTISGVPFSVWLYRVETMGLPPFVKAVAKIDYFDREEKRLKRIKKACDDKFPKLAIWKRDHNARTVLVLEDNDVQFTNQGIVAETLLKVASEAKNVPDEIWLVMSCAEPWIVFPMIVGHKSYPELSYQMTQIGSEKLVSLTNR